ncbi:MAG: hypothetical protein WA594_15535 [Candidatus Sulfotelmatobacter sp.]
MGFNNELDLAAVWAATVTTGEMRVMAENPANTKPSKSRGMEDDILLQGRMTLRMALLVGEWLSFRMVHISRE